MLFLLAYEIYMDYPSVKEALKELQLAEKINPGKWIKHSENVALAAKMIAKQCNGADPEKAYILGILHDIGRRVGVVSMRHILEGYKFCMEKGWSAAAKICMTHSYMIKDVHSEIAKKDVNEQEYKFIQTYISQCQYDFYDKLIQLCDSLATDYGICLLETRFVDVARRYGVCEYTIPRWNAVFEIKDEIERDIGCSIYEIVPVKII